VRSRAWKALPWAAALTGTAVAAWALLRLRRAPAHYGGKRIPEPDPVILTDAVRDAIADAVDAQHQAERPDGGSRMQAALCAAGTPPAVLRVRLQQFPATWAAVDLHDGPALLVGEALVGEDTLFKLAEVAQVV
jgi:hypothetical protein